MFIFNGVTTGLQSPQLRDGQAKRTQKGPIFKPYRVRWGIGGPFFVSLRGGPEFEVYLFTLLQESFTTFCL